MDNITIEIIDCCNILAGKVGILRQFVLQNFDEFKGRGGTDNNEYVYNQDENKCNEHTDIKELENFTAEGNKTMEI